MNAIDIKDTLATLANNTERTNAEKAIGRSGSSDLNQDAFLQLLMAQMQNQDPMNPVSNEDFLAQQAQFSTLSEMQKLNETMSGSNQIMQASSLIGKEVTLTDPDNPTQTLKGIVKEAKFNENGASLTIGDKDYPMDSLLSVKEPGASTETDEETEEEIEEEIES